jgi:signal transduction histidine kinase
MQSARTQSTISLGFFAIAVLFFAIVAIWLATVSTNNTNLRQLNSGESQRQLVFAMRDAAHQRNLALFRMVALQDVFARDSEYLRFKQSAGHFIAARQQLLEHHLNADTAEHWHSVKPLIKRSESLQNAIVELIMADHNAAALSLIQQDFIPTQRRVSQELSNMLNTAREDITKNLDTASAATQTHYQIILLLVLAATSIGYMIAKTVLRRSDEAHNVLLTKNQQIHAINAAISRPQTTIEEQINSILQLGCNFLAMESGLLISCVSNHSATILGRYPNNDSANDSLKSANEQKLLDTLSKFLEDTEILVTNATSSAVDRTALHDALNLTNITSMIAAPLRTSAATKHIVTFVHSQTVQLTSEAQELIQLLGDKLAVLLDQQETLSQLHNAKLAAEAANKTKTVFFANITDELRTPLRSLMNHSESLHEIARQHKHREYVNDLEKIHESSQQLCALISNLLDMTQLESGNMELEPQPIDIESLLRNIESLLEPLITKSDNQFESQILNELGTMHSDPERIRQVLATLLSFAGKLTHQGKVCLTAWREPCPEGDWLYIEIADTSHGISKKQLNHLFKLIIADSIDQDRTAMGPEVQLAISKKICELLGGDILVDSKPNHGTTFTVCLPCYSQQLMMTSATA